MSPTLRRLVAVCALCSACVSVGCAAQRARDSELGSRAPSEVQQKALLERGLAFSRAGDGERAEEYLGAALDAGAQADEALPPLLESCIQARRYRSAVEHAEEHLHRLHRKLPEIEMLLAALYLSLDEPERAVSLLDRVLAAEPRNATAHYVLARTLREHFQDLERADAHYRAYLELEPEGRYAEMARSHLLTFIAPAALTGAERGPEAAPVRIRAAELELEPAVPELHARTP